MFNLKARSKETYLIKNIVQKSFEKDFTINPINSLVFTLFSCAAFIIYNTRVEISDFNELIIFFSYPVLGLMCILLAGKWESMIKISFFAIIGFFWWKKMDSFYYTLPITAASFIAPMFQLAKEWERAVLLRFGKFRKLKGPGVFMIFPFSDSINKIVDLRIRSTDFAAETTITKDSVPITVDAIAFWMVWDPEKAVLEVENYIDAVILSAQTALRDAVGENDLSEFIAKREELGEEVRKAVDKKTTEWGITIQSIEIRDITIPKQLEDALSKKAQAEREKESRIILGEAEIELANKFLEASKTYDNDETALKLRSMNILFEGLKAGNSTMMVPSSIIDNMNLGNFMGMQAINEVNKEKHKSKKMEVKDENHRNK